MANKVFMVVVAVAVFSHRKLPFNAEVDQIKYKFLAASLSQVEILLRSGEHQISEENQNE